MKAPLFFLIWFFTLGFPLVPMADQGRVMTKEEMANFDWLIGKWERTNNRPGNLTYEYWEKVDDSFYKGFGFTLKDLDTVWQERINLIKTKENWQYEVRGQNAKKPTIFKLTKIESFGFTSENKTNEFPKKIRYEKVEAGLRAIISGGGKQILFDFKTSP